MQKSVFCAMRTQMRKTNSIQKGQGKRQKGNIFLSSPDL